MCIVAYSLLLNSTDACVNDIIRTRDFCMYLNPDDCGACCACMSIMFVTNALLIHSHPRAHQYDSVPNRGSETQR